MASTPTYEAVALALCHTKLERLRNLIVKEDAPWTPHVAGLIALALSLIQAQDINKTAVKAKWNEIHQALLWLQSETAWTPSRQIATAIDEANLAVSEVPISYCT